MVNPLMKGYDIPMEKYGVSKEELKDELRTKYAELIERYDNLVKTGSVNTEAAQQELLAVKAKLDSLDK